ncbi:MAG: Holliday junction resolvase RecU [Lactococcus chungangensis]|uniref:Holliday junction resolvase RecU n=1 Tax=Pseudolactococcus chungangensis CAU 28 = DSM 22330 TaxID=1122154 RepID=A0A1K2H5X3_9LACT|nr:Holliday junction resolvase RecU [Lactococcus chungangensis]MDD3015652.1 Holliday junction resolvase RecU [Lactococcus chungangensis]NCB81294.1 Holliday junction resolvase RecU [Bacilli bacterium]PCS04597.1 Holliday junction resolvase [Lactococcus chungangensis CAU 28 = DSM 22330]SFZ71637.1 recombination protein U [Lactococcus chungangensis CAU 28 = DSM 22330]
MVKYPGGVAIARKQQIKQLKTVKFGKRGMNFEAEINATNAYYLMHGLAVIHKKPTPVQIVKVDYPKRSRAKITEAYFRQASTTDYSGVYQGHYLDFEAKETQNKTSFPLKNFHEHQIVHMENVLKQEGIAFVLLHFSALSRTFLLKASDLIPFFKEKEGQKSIALAFIETKGYELPTNQLPSIPYLDCIQKLIGGDSHF